MVVFIYAYSFLTVYFSLQSPWSGNIPQRKTVSNNLATVVVVPRRSITTTATPALAPVGGQVALPPCNWTEHTSPKG
ncbi:hypothetical protein MKX01_032724, partial [Papaver californicum]